MNSLHHVGVIVPNEEQALALLEILGLEIDRREYVDAYQADCIFTKGQGGVLELIVPRGGKLREFNRGLGGLHHLAIKVDGLDAYSDQLRNQGYELLSEEPVDAGPIRINFLPPVYTRGITLELIEVKPAA